MVHTENAGGAPATTALSRKDFQTDQDVRWCPGCGDYSILAAIQKVFPELGIPREKIAIISGIGCAARFPYYMNTYGFHAIHGRALAIATGLRATNPDLSVWVVSGDGDALSIGGNHLLHAIRRNIDVKLLIFNNRIYGLTKGQYSPTSEQGKRTKSTPYGSIDGPVMPLAFALGASATFVARTVDREPNHMRDMIHRVARHRGTAVLEILQNCNIFNDGAWDAISDRKTKADNQLVVGHGKPLLFGPDNQKAIVRRGFGLAAVNRAEVGENEILVHDETADPAYHFQLARMEGPELPVALGVLRAEERPTYDEMLHAQVAAQIEKKGRGDLQALLRGKNTWTVA